MLRDCGTPATGQSVRTGRGVALCPVQARGASAVNLTAAVDCGRQRKPTSASEGGNVSSPSAAAVVSLRHLTAAAEACAGKSPYFIGDLAAVLTAERSTQNRACGRSKRPMPGATTAELTAATRPLTAADHTSVALSATASAATTRAGFAAPATGWLCGSAARSRCERVRGLVAPVEMNGQHASVRPKRRKVTLCLILAPPSASTSLGRTPVNPQTR